MSLTKPQGTKLICLTPVANEAFQLDRFLRCASIWADHIIAGYQNSADDTLKILQKYDKVTIVNSPSQDWNELVMRSLLYSEARKIQADKRIIMNLDADEILSANFMESSEWHSIMSLPLGSVIRIPWANLQPDMTHYVPSNMIEVGFVDDGVSELKGSLMHMGRVPWPEYDIQIMKCNRIKLLHFQATNPLRIKSKSRWYRAYEKVGKGEFGPNIYRKYSSPNVQPTTLPLPEEWIAPYDDMGIDVTSVAFSYDYSHDYRLLEYLDQFGPKYFRMVDIWEMDWAEFAIGKKQHPERFQDPRTKFDLIVFKYMKWSAETVRTPSKGLLIDIIDGMLKIIGYSS